MKYSKEEINNFFKEHGLEEQGFAGVQGMRTIKQENGYVTQLNVGPKGWIDLPGTNGMGSESVSMGIATEILTGSKPILGAVGYADGQFGKAEDYRADTNEVDNVEGTMTPEYDQDGNAVEATDSE